MRVDHTSAAEALAQIRTVRPAAAEPARTHFAAALRDATTTAAATPAIEAAGTAATTSGTRSAGTATSSGTTPATAATGGTSATTGSDAAAGETTKPVEGKPYEKILSGPREGMYINRSGNARDGEAFVLVEKPGRDIHVYGTGDDRHAIVMWHADPGRPPAGEVAAKVDGEAYEKITAGPRKGMYINRSGNERDGFAFRLVEHAHRDDHVYGTGQYRQDVRLWDEGYGPHAAGSTPGPTAAKVGPAAGSTSGGTAAGAAA